MNAVLMTGANGFIGSAVLRAWEAASPTRSLVLTSRSGGTQRSPIDHPHLALDLLSECVDLPTGVDTVLHLAGEKRDSSRMCAVNHLGAVRLVEAASRAGATRFVHLSSVGVYGVAKNAGVVNETCRHTPQNAYERSKDAGEQAVRERCAALGLACVVLQPSNVVGVVPGRSLPLLGLARRVAHGGFRYFGRGEPWVNYVAVEDVAAALVAATKPDATSGVFIVNTPAPLHTLLGWMADELGVSAPRQCWPLWVGAAAGAAGSLGRAVLRRELPFSREHFLELTNTTRYDGSALTRAFGSAYSLGIEGALRAMMQYYRKEGLI